MENNELEMWINGETMDYNESDMHKLIKEGNVVIVRKKRSEYLKFKELILENQDIETLYREVKKLFNIS